jgi:hypothetical protein
METDKTVDNSSKSSASPGGQLTDSRVKSVSCCQEEIHVVEVALDQLQNNGNLLNMGHKEKEMVVDIAVNNAEAQGEQAPIKPADLVGGAGIPVDSTGDSGFSHGRHLLGSGAKSGPCFQDGVQEDVHIQSSSMVMPQGKVSSIDNSHI